MMMYVSREAFDVLLCILPAEVMDVDEVSQAPMVGVELVPPGWWEAFKNRRRNESEDLSAVIIRTGSLKDVQEYAASEARQRTWH